MNTWTLEGHLGNGVAVYQHENGGLAVEMDPKYLTDPTREETAEIYDRMPHLRPKKEAKL